MMKIAEIVGMQGDTIALQDIFEFRNTGVDAEGRITGYFSPTGYVLTFMDRFKWAGVTLPDEFFTPR